MTGTAPPRLDPDGMLWQLLKGYANEDWGRAAAPWPAPADAFLAECSPAEAQALADELAEMISKDMDDDAWRALLRSARADVAALRPDGSFTGWAADLRRRAAAK